MFPNEIISKDNYLYHKNIIRIMSLPSYFKQENYEDILIYHYVEELISSFVEFADENLKDDIITTNNLRFLLRIRFSDKTTQKDLVNLFKVSDGYTAKILRNFEDSELISRKEDPANRRRKIVELTEKGIEKTDIIIKTIDEHEKQQSNNMTDEEFRQLKKLLFKLLSRN